MWGLQYRSRLGVLGKGQEQRAQLLVMGGKRRLKDTEMVRGVSGDGFVPLA